MQTTGMRWLDMVKLRLRSLTKRGRMEAELEDEIRFHMDHLVDRYLSDGATPDAARRRAALELGMPDAIKDHCRDARGVSFVENLGRDIVYALRGMRKSPGFVLTAAAAIALGIGANTALFSLVYSLMFRALPVADPGSFRNIHVSTFGEGNRSGFGTPYNVSWHEFNFLRTSAKTAEVGGLAEVEMSRAGDPRTVRAHLVSDNLLPMLGRPPLLGRFIRPEEAARPGAEPVAVLSYRAWQDWFGGAQDAVGRTVTLNRVAFMIVGIADERTTGPVLLVPDLWIPLSMQAITRAGEPLIDSPTNGWIQLFGRLRPEFNEEAMRAELQVLGQQALLPHLPKRKAQVIVEPGAYMNFPFVQRQFKPMFAILTLAVSLVLIVACANVANMLVARGLTRRREIAIRLSIGAGRRRLLQQLLTESTLLALIGGIAGLFLAWGGAAMLLAMIPFEMIGRHQLDLSPDGAVLLFTIAVALLTGLVFGLLPALHSLRFDLTPSLKSEGLEDGRRGGRKRLQNALIALQVAVCLVLLVNAGLLVRGFIHALTLDPGQRTSNILVTSFDLRQQQYSADKAAHFMGTLRQKIAALPAVQAVSVTLVEPLHDQCGSVARIPNGSEGMKEVRTSCDEIGPDYFRTVGTSVVAGREFTEAEMFNESRIAIIDERFAGEHFGAVENAMRQWIRLGPNADSYHEIVGVVRSIQALDLNGFHLPRVYTPMRGLRNNEGKLVVAYAGRSADIERGLRNAVASLDPGVTPRVKRIEESLRGALLPARMAAAAASALGGLALVLACTGVYGLVSFAISRRRREVGIRMALGATKGAVLKVVVWQGLKPVMVGSVAGLLLAGASAHAVRAMLYGVSPLDPLSFALTGALLAAIAGIAALIPARAALAVDPSVTLRHD